MIRSSNLSLEFVRKFGIELSPIRLHPHPPTRGTHETRSRALTRGRHARTHASWERRSCVPSILLAPRRKLGERARRRTNGQEGGEGGAGRGRNATNFRAARRVYHCPRIPAELRVHGNKGKCASPIGSDRSIETVNPIYVAVISIILCLRSYYHFPPLPMKFRPLSSIDNDNDENTLVGSRRSRKKKKQGDEISYVRTYFSQFWRIFANCQLVERYLALDKFECELSKRVFRDL